MRTFKTALKLLAALTLLGLAVREGWRYKRNALAQAAEAKRELAERAKRPVPVLAAKAVTRDVPVWLSNPGTVAAFNLVTVRPRVSGTLDSVHFAGGENVEAGDLLAQLDPRPYRAVLDQALARLAQDEALHLNATQELARAQSLVASGAETRRTLDAQAARAAELAAALQADRAAIAAAQLDLDFTSIRAPLSGRTGIRRIDAGNTVTAGQPEGIVVITQVRPVHVLFSLPQRHLPDILPGLAAAAPFPAQALDERTGALLGEGTLAVLDNVLDTATDSLRLKAVFPNPSDALWPGQYVTARVKVATLPSAVLVPNAAVQPGLDGPFVYTVTPGGTAEPRPVTPGPLLPGEDLRVIEKGLAPGETVVTEGQNKLRPGAAVAIADAPAPRNGGE